MLNVLISANGDSVRIKNYLFTNKLNVFYRGEPVTKHYEKYKVAGNVYLASNTDVLSGLHYCPDISGVTIPKTNSRIESIKRFLYEAPLKGNLIVVDCDVMFRPSTLKLLSENRFLYSNAPKDGGQYGYVDLDEVGRINRWSEKEIEMINIYVGAGTINIDKFLNHNFQTDSIIEYYSAYGSIGMHIRNYEYDNIGDIKNYIKNSNGNNSRL